MSGLGPERFYAGRQLVYQDNAAMNESERQAALVDQMRRQEMLRRNDPARRAPIPQGPNLNRAGLQMPAPVAAPAAPVDPNAARRADSARFMDIWNGGNAPQETPTVDETADTRNYHFDGMMAALPQLVVAEDAMNANQRQQWNLVRNAYGRLTRREISPESYRRFLDNAARAGVIAPTQANSIVPQQNARPHEVIDVTTRGQTQQATRLGAPQQATRLGAPQQTQQGQGARAIFLQGGTTNRNGTVNTGDHGHITLPASLAGRAEEVRRFLEQNGVTVNSARRTENAGAEHPVGNAVDVNVANQQEANAVAALVDQFAAQVGGSQQAQAPDPVVQQIFQAAAQGPQGTSYIEQQLLERRTLAAQRLQLAQQVGDTAAIDAGFQALQELDATRLANFGAAAAMTLGYTGNTEAWSQFFAETTGHQLTFQPYSDGSYEIIIDGTPQGRQTRAELQQNALTMVDDQFRQRAQSRQDSDYEAERDSRYRRLEAYETALFRGMTDVEVARIRAEAAQRTGSQDVEFKDIGDGQTIAIYTNASGQRVASLVEINSRRSPTTGGGRGEERDVLVFGPETAWGQ